MPVIDSHVHHYPPEVLKDPRAWALAHDEPYWLSLVTDQPGHKSIQGWATTDQLLRDMDDAGIEKVVLQGWYWENQATCDIQNDFYLKIAKEHPDRFIPFIALQPKAGEVALEALKRAIDRGAKGVGELSIGTQGFSVKDSNVFELIECQGLVINFHVAEALSRDYFGKTEPTDLRDFLYLAKKFPNMKIILSHLGGGVPFFEHNPYIRDIFKNVYYDTAALPLMYHIDVINSLLSMIGPDKLLFGSDYPLRLYPGQESQPSFKRFLDNFKKSTSISKEDFNKVLYKNILKLISN